MVHGISCCVCLEGGKDGWGCLPCGHVLHVGCILRMFDALDLREERRKTGECPLCKRKVKLSNVTKLFLTESAEGEGLDLSEDCVNDLDVRDQINSLKSRIFELTNALNHSKKNCSMEKEEKERIEERADNLSMELEKLRQSSNEKLKTLRKERDIYLHDARVLENKVANLKIELERERAYAARQLVTLDVSLTGDSLVRKLKSICDTKEWFYQTLESRNKKIGSLMKNLEQVSREKTLLQTSMQALKRENESLHQGIRVQAKGNQERSKVYSLDEIENISPGGIEQNKYPIWDADMIGLRARPGERRERDESLDQSAGQIIILDDSDEGEAKPQEKVVHSSTFLSRAGPSKMAMKAAPGPSFIQKSNLATTGLEDPGTFIKRVPDGKGGWKQVYRNQPLQQAAAKRAKIVSTGKTIPNFFKK